MGEKIWLTMFGTHLLIGFGCSLRGNEILLLETRGLLNYIKDGTHHDDKVNPHVVIPLLGRFENEWGEQWHLMLTASVTRLGFKVQQWVERLVVVLLKEKKYSGCAFCDEDGEIFCTKLINEEFWKQLEKVRKIRLDLIPLDLDIPEVYNIRRSLMRGSVTTAREEGAGKDAIDTVNRWRTAENRRVGRIGGSMREYYTEVRLVCKLLVAYSKVLQPPIK